MVSSNAFFPSLNCYASKIVTILQYLTSFVCGQGTSQTPHQQQEIDTLSLTYKPWLSSWNFGEKDLK